MRSLNQQLQALKIEIQDARIAMKKLAEVCRDQKRYITELETLWALYHGELKRLHKMLARYTKKHQPYRDPRVKH